MANRRWMEFLVLSGVEVSPPASTEFQLRLITGRGDKLSRYMTPFHGGILVLSGAEVFASLDIRRPPGWSARSPRNKKPGAVKSKSANI